MSQTVPIPQPGRGGSWHVSVAPADRPVQPAEFFRHCRIDASNGAVTESDACLFIDAAVEYAETRLAASLMPRTIVAAFQSDQVIDLPRGPVIGIASITDGNDNPVTDYDVRAVGAATRITPATAVVWPITVTYRAGYALTNGATPAIPADIKLALLMHAATLYENRESIADKAMLPVPHSLDAFYARKARTVGVR